jgi:hypothetical protein
MPLTTIPRRVSPVNGLNMTEIAAAKGHPSSHNSSIVSTSKGAVAAHKPPCSLHLNSRPKEQQPSMMAPAVAHDTHDADEDDRLCMDIVGGSK